MMLPSSQSSVQTNISETTPLVPPRIVGSRVDGNQYATRKRNNNGLVMPQLQEDNHMHAGATNMQDDTITDDKEDRRPWIIRVVSGSASRFMKMMRPRTANRTTPSSSGNTSTAANENDDQLFYEDDHNDESWKCSFGTREDDGVWVNLHDRVGLIMACTVWVLIAYSGITISLLAQYGHISNFIAMVYITIAGLALSSHAKTTFTDPGSIPAEAVPIDVYSASAHAMCSRCQSYKPPFAHHCRICDRCVSRMDHHCPWMNNCIGAGNLKHFILCIIYIWILCAYALIVFGCNYFFCNNQNCEFSIILVQLVRAMTLIALGTILFTSSMLTSMLYTVLTGIGTIDRLKKKADGTWEESDEKPIELEQIFGIGGTIQHYWTWFLPIDPLYKDYDEVMGYSTPQRLLRREQMIYSNSNQRYNHDNHLNNNNHNDMNGDANNYYDNKMMVTDTSNYDI